MTTTNLLQQHLDEVRADLRRAQAVFGESPVPPPANIVPDETMVRQWIEGACPTSPSPPRSPSSPPLLGMTPRAGAPLPTPPDPPFYLPGVSKDPGPVPPAILPGCR